MLIVLIARFVVVPDIVDLAAAVVVCCCCWSQCLQTSWGFGVDVTVGRLEVYSHQRSDKDQPKEATRTNRQISLEYIRLQVQVLHATITTSDDITQHQQQPPRILCITKTTITKLFDCILYPSACLLFDRCLLLLAIHFRLHARQRKGYHVRYSTPQTWMPFTRPSFCKTWKFDIKQYTTVGPKLLGFGFVQCTIYPYANYLTPHIVL